MQKAGVFYNKDMSTNVTILTMLFVILLLIVCCGLLFWRMRKLQTRLRPFLSDDVMVDDSAAVLDSSQTFVIDETSETGEAMPEYPLVELESLDPLRREKVLTLNAADSTYAANRSGFSTRPVVLGLISHKGGTGKTTTALELARSWAQKGFCVLLVDADPAQAATALMGIQPSALGEIQAVANNLDYAHWLPDSWPQPARWPENFLQGWDLIVVDTPSLQNALTVQLLPILDALVLTLTLEPACMRVLEQGAILLERKLDPLRQRLLGVLVTRYQPLNALQTSLYGTLQREYVGILLPESIPEDSQLTKEVLDLGDLAKQEMTPARETYQLLAERLYSQLKPLKGRAGGQP